MRFHQTAAIALIAAGCALAVVACGSVAGQAGQAGQAGESPSAAATTPATAPASATASASATNPAPATASATSSTVTTSGTTQTGTAACATSQLKIALSYTGALAGQAGGLLRFTNDSRVTCRISGWPSVTGLSASGKATTLKHARSTMFGAWTYSSPAPVVTLRPGSSAYAVVAADDLPVNGQTSCPAPDVRLRVAAPGSKSTVLISAWLSGARSYLPACTSIGGAPSGEVSTITTLAKIAH